MRPSLQCYAALMSAKRLIPFLLLSMLMGGASAAAPSGERTPIIQFDKKEHSFGVVEEGVDISCCFKIKNAGNGLLQVFEVKSTCGCTIPVICKKLIPAGESVDLKVVVDTSMKQGDVSKEITVRSNDPKNPISKIYVRAMVTDPHAGLNGNRSAKIFSGKCASCHVAMGEGKLGEDLYLADCAMCHGFSAKGAVGPGLLQVNYKDAATHRYIQEIIEAGSLVHRSMPGFLKEKGGPLSKEQVNSLMTYLQWRAETEASAVKK